MLLITGPLPDPAFLYAMAGLSLTLARPMLAFALVVGDVAKG